MHEMSDRQDKINTETSGQTTLELGKAAVWHLICKERETRSLIKLQPNTLEGITFYIAIKYYLAQIGPYFTASMDGCLCTVAQTGERPQKPGSRDSHPTKYTRHLIRFQAGK